MRFANRVPPRIYLFSNRLSGSKAEGAGCDTPLSDLRQDASSEPLELDVVLLERITNLARRQA